MKKLVTFLIVMSINGMELPEEQLDSPQKLLAKILQSQQIQHAELKKLSEQHHLEIKAIKEYLFSCENEQDKRKKITPEEKREEVTLNQLRKEVQELIQACNIQNKTLQKLDSSCSEVVKKKSQDHAGWLKRLENEIHQLKTSHELLSNDLEGLNKSILTRQRLLEHQQTLLNSLNQQMHYHISCLGSVITILQSVAQVTTDIQTRLERLPLAIIHQPPTEFLAEPITPVLPHDGTIDPSFLMKDSS